MSRLHLITQLQMAKLKIRLKLLKKTLKIILKSESNQRDINVKLLHFYLITEIQHIALRDIHLQN